MCSGFGVRVSSGTPDLEDGDSFKLVLIESFDAIRADLDPLAVHLSPLEVGISFGFRSRIIITA